MLLALGGLLLAVGRADAMTATAPAAATTTCASGTVPAGETAESTWTGLHSAVAGVASGASGTFALQATITAGDSAGDQLAVPAGASVTIDLCGFALSITSPPVEDAAIAVPATSTFTVADNSSGQNGMLTAVASATAGATADLPTGAGIGGDADGTASGIVNLDSGSVTATGGDADGNGGGAGIGSGGYSNAGGSGAITIATDGTVTATGGAGTAGGGAGIGGGGSQAAGGNLTGDLSITDNATVSATGGSGQNSGGGAGIGGGGSDGNLPTATGGDVTGAVDLDDATVRAAGGASGGPDGGAGAGIGGGGGGDLAIGSFAAGQLNANVDVSDTQLQVSPGNSGNGIAYGIGQGAPGIGGTDAGSGSGAVQLTGGSGVHSVLSGDGTVPATVSAAVNVTGGELDIPSGLGAALSGGVSIAINAALAIEPDSTLTVSGSLVNDSFLDILGTVTVTGSFTNNAFVFLVGTLTLGSEAENASDGQIFLEGGVLDGGPVSNAGSIESDAPSVAPMGTVNATVTDHSYDLTLNAGTGASVSPTSEEVYAATLDDANQILPTPTPPSGGTFDGWYTATSGGSQVTPTSELSSTPGPEDIQLYALYGFSQAISFTQPSSPASVSQSAALSGTGGGSGQPVSFSVDASSSPADVCAVSEDSSGQYTVSYEHVGSCVIDANQASGQTGQDTYSTAPQTQQTVTVTQASQSITFTQPASPATAGSTATLSATGGASAQPVIFSVDPSTSAGVCTVTSTTVSYLRAGSCVIDANQAGTSDYTAAAQVQQTVSVQATPAPTPTPAPAPTTTTPAPTTTTTAPPAPSARATLSAGAAGLTYVFSAAHSSANGAHISSYVWTLNGKPIGTGPKITHTFPQAGKPESVVLTVHSSDGMSAQSTVHLTPRGVNKTVKLTLHFIADHAALTSTDRDELIKLRAIFAHASTVHIAGYSAAQSTRTTGVLLRLSRQRAGMVLALLRTHQNHSTAKITLTGYGASHFITTNTTTTGRAENRRATLIITYLKPSI